MPVLNYIKNLVILVPIFLTQNEYVVDDAANLSTRTLSYAEADLKNTDFHCLPSICETYTYWFTSFYYDNEINVYFCWISMLVINIYKILNKNRIFIEVVVMFRILMVYN